jgi:hypothetical protein
MIEEFLGLPVELNGNMRTTIAVGKDTTLKSHRKCRRFGAISA